MDPESNPHSAEKAYRTDSDLLAKGMNSVAMNKRVPAVMIKIVLNGRTRSPKIPGRIRPTQEPTPRTDSNVYPSSVRPVSIAIVGRRLAIPKMANSKRKDPPVTKLKAYERKAAKLITALPCLWGSW